MLEQQNERLVEKVSFCEIYNNSNLSDIKSFSPNYEFKVIDCKGNVSEQTVSVTVTLKHSLPHQSVKLFIGSQKPIAYGETGNSFEYKEAEFPQSSGIMGYQSFNMPTDILIKGTLVFRNVLSHPLSIAVS